MDKGIGISKEDQEKIFSPFYRGVNARTSKGFGLGLSICKRIIDQHKGKIRVESELNKGSIFTIHLPYN